MRDARSSLFVHVARIRDLSKLCFPWAQVQSLIESVASMNGEDEHIMSTSFGELPWGIDSCHLSLCRRPRLYWVDWELQEGNGATFGRQSNGRGEVILTAPVEDKKYLLPGWLKYSDEKFPTFTTARPRGKPGYKQAGLNQCNPHELDRWRQDAFRFPPYQYRDAFCLQNKAGQLRLRDMCEREVIKGLPRDYTLQCFPKSHQGSQAHLDERLCLIGNSWRVPVVTWLLGQVGAALGLNEQLSLDDVVKRTAPGCTKIFKLISNVPLWSKFGILQLRGVKRLWSRNS